MSLTNLFRLYGDLKSFPYILFCFIFLLILPKTSFTQSAEALVKQADQLDSELKEPEALQKYLTAKKIKPNDEYILWNISFLYSKIGFRFDDDDEKEKYFLLAEDFAKRAIKANPNNPECNYVMGVAMGRIAEIASPGDRVAAAREIKKYAEITLKLDPKHDLGWHLLAKWHYRAANLSWPEEIAADLFFGGLGEASNEESVKAFKKAIELDPYDVLYYLDYALELEEIDKEEEAIEILKKGLKLNPRVVDDPMYLQQCKELLEDLE